MSEKMTRPLLFILLSCVLYIGVLCIQPKCFQEKSVDFYCRESSFGLMSLLLGQGS